MDHGDGGVESDRSASSGLEGRIAAVADVFDALTSDRIYRRAFALGQALEIMTEERGGHVDADLLDLFLDSMDGVLAIWQTYSDERIGLQTPVGNRRHPIA